MPGSSDLSVEARPFRVRFGLEAPPSTEKNFSVPVPVLAGESIEELFPPVHESRSDGPWTYFEEGDRLVGFASEPVSHSDLEARTAVLYEKLLSICGNRSLYRIWNYVPLINAERSGLKNYRAFCRARAGSFEKSFGPDYKSGLPAGSAVGGPDDRLQIVFVAGRSAAHRLENPEQVPAYEYPPEYGPRSPSFSRAVRARVNDRDYVFISGTSAIKGYATIGAGLLEEQVNCTRNNLRLISTASGLGPSLAANAGWQRHFKIYLRKAEDLLAARRLLEGSLLQEGDIVTWLRADICRAALQIEIEATLWR